MKDITSILKAAAASPAMRPGAGMPNISGGGSGSYIKLPSLSGTMKSTLTKATKQVGDAAKKQEVIDPRTSMFSATTQYYADKNNPRKNAAFTGDVSRLLGYSPGIWYNSDSYSPVQQTRVGNLISGVGLAGAGLLSIPILQKLFPERFKGKTKQLAALSVLGGMATPWMANLPSTIADLNRFRTPSETQWRKDKQETIGKMRISSGIDPTKTSYVTGTGSDLNYLMSSIKASNIFSDVPSGGAQADFRNLPPSAYATDFQMRGGFMDALERLQQQRLGALTRAWEASGRRGPAPTTQEAIIDPATLASLQRSRGVSDELLYDPRYTSTMGEAFSRGLFDDQAVERFLPSTGEFNAKNNYGLSRETLYRFEHPAWLRDSAYTDAPPDRSQPLGVPSTFGDPLGNYPIQSDFADMSFDSGASGASRQQLW